MTAYPGFTYTDAYNLPISIRKWFIKQYNKRQEASSKGSQDINVPLNPQQKSKLMEQSKQYSNDPSKISNFMGSNKKK